MRRLLLLRHAKSSWARGDLDDASRPLAPRGLRAAPLIGRYVESRGLVPGLVLCSTATRAKETLELVAAEWDRAAGGTRTRVEMRASIYLATPIEILEAISRFDDDIRSAMIIGHNPGIAALAQRLAAKGDPRGMKTMATKFPTAALAVLDLDIESWQAASPGTGYLQSFVRPKDLT